LEGRRRDSYDQPAAGIGHHWDHSDRAARDR
jgi:hypothetical protein